MSFAQAGGGAGQNRLRVWPGVTVAVLELLVWLIVPRVLPDAVAFAVMAGLAGGLIILIWWLFFSRAAWVERVGAVVLMAAVAVATRRFLDKSIVTGMMGLMFWIYVIPVLSLALVAWAVATRRLPDGLRRTTLVATILAACGFFSLLRTNGITGEGGSDFAWRWSQTAEQKLLAGARVAAPSPPPAAAKTEIPAKEPPPPPAELPHPAAALPTSQVAGRALPEWPGFRGPHRDGVVRGVRIETDWTVSPPAELWRRPVGPGWSSFAAGGGLLYTQEQRGEFEVVACYRTSTGEPVWTHRDAVRFWESNAGAGPRATPTLSGGRVYTFGATGILNALDADTGAVVWTRSAASDTGAKVPGWGFSSSPLVTDDLVIVAAAGRLAAYDPASGEPRWKVADGGMSYSSPQLATIGGVPQVLLLSQKGVTSVAPADGKVLWKHSWDGFKSLQPALTADGDILITSSGDTGGLGTRRLAAKHGEDGWTVSERWTSRGLKPYFNDMVVNKGYAFGFDGSILACIGLQDGERKWKGGRYGNGQVILLPDQDLLLVLSEEGEVALVAATPGQFTEIAKFHAIEGKTWNHPVLCGDTLLVRNGEEMAAFRLALAGG